MKTEVPEKKELTQEEKAAEERRLLAESYRKHKIESHPTEEFWVPPVRKFLKYCTVSSDCTEYLLLMNSCFC